MSLGQGYFHPGELSAAPSGAFFAPLFLWIYLLVVLVLLINLLIAMFNDQYRTVMQDANLHGQLINVRRVMVYLMQ